jgi:hypothetical protein
VGILSKSPLGSHVMVETFTLNENPRGNKSHKYFKNNRLFFANLLLANLEERPLLPPGDGIVQIGHDVISQASYGPSNCHKKTKHHLPGNPHSLEQVKT